MTERRFIRGIVRVQAERRVINAPEGRIAFAPVAVAEHAVCHEQRHGDEHDPTDHERDDQRVVDAGTGIMTPGYAQGATPPEI